MILLILSTIALVLVGVAYFVGLFDRPKFEYRSSLLKSGKQLYILAAPCQEPSYPKHIPRICEGTIDAVNTLPNSKQLLQDGAALYDVPEGAKRLCVGLYFDDPWKTNTPRWAIGWAVGVKDFTEAQALAKVANKNKPAALKETMVAVRLGPTGGVAGRLRWRTPITPMVMPMIMWSRAYEAYTKGGYKADNGRGDNDEDGSIACEVYVTTGEGPNDKGQYIDYIVLSGDTKNAWDDAFPVVL